MALLSLKIHLTPHRLTPNTSILSAPIRLQTQHTSSVPTLKPSILSSNNSEFRPRKSSLRSLDGETNWANLIDGDRECRGKPYAKDNQIVSSSILSGGLYNNASSQIFNNTTYVPRLKDSDPSVLLFQQRIIFLAAQVDDASADAIINQLLVLDAQDSEKDIKLFINSPGGSVTAGMGIYDAMKLCKADVSTICFGLAASMGAFLLAAGSKGKRFCMPNSRVMIHQPLGGMGGSAIEVGLQVREMMYHKVKINKILARATGKTEAQLEIDTDRDNFMNPWEAMEYGLIDGVIDDGKPGLIAPIGQVKEPPRTRINKYWAVKDGKGRRILPGEINILPTKPQ